MIIDYINLECLALTLDLPKTYLKDLVDAGKIPYLPVGKRKRFLEQDVRAALSKLTPHNTEQGTFSDSDIFARGYAVGVLQHRGAQV